MCVYTYIHICMGSVGVHTDIWVVLKSRVPFWYPQDSTCRHITYRQKRPIIFRTFRVSVDDIRLHDLPQQQWGRCRISRL